MRRTGSIDRYEIDAGGGALNQAFTGFASGRSCSRCSRTDAVVSRIRARCAAPTTPTNNSRFVDGVMAQARDTEAAEATRPFAINGNRLAAEFPDQVAASRTELLDLLRPAITALGGDAGDVELVHDLTMARMNTALVERRVPDRHEV